MCTPNTSKELSSNAPTTTTHSNSKSASRFDQQQAALLASHLKIDLKNVRHASIPETSEVYHLLTTYILEKCVSLDNDSINSDDAVNYSKDFTPETSSIFEHKHVRPKITERRLGLGAFSFEHDGQTLHCLHRRVAALNDDETKANCEPKILTTLIIFVEGSDNDYCKDVVEGLINHLLNSENENVTRQSSKKTYNVYRWMTDYSIWKKDIMAPSRPLQSVILKSKVKDTVIQDMNDFLDDKTLEFYQNHSIPYKRSYLFHGPSGSGKTSFIQALATKYQSNVCYIQPSDPKMTDELLMEAIRQTPRRSIIVLEDIDAFFTKKGKRSSHLTLSGILNALDGVGNSPLGQIIILTTNHREKLDPVLIRNGRVDLHVHFTPATMEMMENIFLVFYPSEGSLAKVFGRKLKSALGDDTPVSMAAMQHFFICNRRSTALEAVENVEQIPANLKSQTHVCDNNDNNGGSIGAISDSGGSTDQQISEKMKAQIDVPKNRKVRRGIGDSKSLRLLYQRRFPNCFQSKSESHLYQTASRTTSTSSGKSIAKSIAELNLPAEIAATLAAVILSMALSKVAWMALSLTLWTVTSRVMPTLSAVPMESEMALWIALWLALLKVVWMALSMALWIVAPTAVIMESGINPWQVGSKVALKVVLKIASKVALKAV